MIGADPAAQGQGHGAALLRSGLAKADAAGLPTYLESSKPSNLPIYEHFGFTVREEVRLPGGGPVLWAMRREPCPPRLTSKNRPGGADGAGPVCSFGLRACPPLPHWVRPKPPPPP